MITVTASSILLEACKSVALAKSLGIQTPKKVSKAFRDRVYTAYFPELTAQGIDVQCIAELLGNNARWNQHFCRLMVLQYLAFFMKRLPSNRNFLPSLLTDAIALPSAQTEIPLLAYANQRMAEQYYPNGPTLFLDARTIAIKSKITIPNVSKINSGVDLEATNFQWINMRYRKTPERVKLLPVPVIRPVKDPITGKLTLVGTIRGLPGDTCKFGYCILAQKLKTLQRIQFTTKPASMHLPKTFQQMASIALYFGFPFCHFLPVQNPYTQIK